MAYEIRHFCFKEFSLVSKVECWSEILNHMKAIARMSALNVKSEKQSQEVGEGIIINMLLLTDFVLFSSLWIFMKA